MIAGAGPVGLVTALLLARWGVPTLVADARERRAGTGSRAICFQGDVLDVLERAGCAREMVAEGVTWTTGRTYYREHELFTVSFPGYRGEGHPPWINISQDRVEELLRARAAAEPLIDLRYDHPVTGYREDATGVQVVAGDSVIHGSHLVGADGGRSTVRDLAGIGFPGRSFDDRFLICDIRADLPFPSERRFYFDPPWNPGRQVLVHHCPGSVWRIDWQVPAGFDPAKADVHAMIRRITGDLPYEIVWLSVYRFQERVAAAFRRGRVFLAGDAAHLYAPFGARGLNSGVQDAENLAWKLGLTRTGGAGGALLDAYEAERRAAALVNLKVTGDTMEFLVPQNEERRAWRRSVLSRAVRDPGARRLIDSGRLAEPYWYTGSPLTTPAGEVPGEPGADRPPVPGVICPDGPAVVDGERTRLRRLFGPAFTVLVARGDRAGAARQAAGHLSGVPARVYALPDIDPGGVLSAALRASPDSVHLVRPDGHLAAVLPEFSAPALEAALARAAGRPGGDVARMGEHGGHDAQHPA
ncbi:FAD-dependent monooxygenase [Spongiactinospora rosea]|uniref:FAD-dependent monooxygenase n=1 Tax=Spongiactinospora rosea TaxID=2248750 RepID=UPI0021F19BB2|nr:FAD-dependent monooxygenase [Spongiactinospora rosea]